MVEVEWFCISETEDEVVGRRTLHDLLYFIVLFNVQWPVRRDRIELVYARAVEAVFDVVQILQLYLEDALVKVDLATISTKTILALVHVVGGRQGLEVKLDCLLLRGHRTAIERCCLESLETLLNLYRRKH